MNQSKINVLSIFMQHTKRQHPMNAKLTLVHSASISMLRVSIASVQNINNQCTNCQQPMNATSMHRASTANPHSTSLPNARFLQHEDFHSEQYASHPCHSARSRRQSRRIHPPTNNPAFSRTCRSDSNVK